MTNYTAAFCCNYPHQQNSPERTKTTKQISSQLMLTIVSEPSSCHIFPSWIFSNALIGACIFLLEVRNFKHPIELPQFNFVGKWHPITSSPINLRNRADKKIVKSVAVPWKFYRLKNRKLWLREPKTQVSNAEDFWL